LDFILIWRIYNLNLKIYNYVFIVMAVNNATKEPSHLPYDQMFKERTWRRPWSW
jgi:hypothetical protein